MAVILAEATMRARTTAAFGFTEMHKKCNKRSLSTMAESSSDPFMANKRAHALLWHFLLYTSNKHFKNRRIFSNFATSTHSSNNRDILQQLYYESLLSIAYGSGKTIDVSVSGSISDRAMYQHKIKHKNRMYSPQKYHLLRAYDPRTRSLHESSSLARAVYHWNQLELCFLRWHIRKCPSLA
ncbi:hypothetical protein EVAR_43267_1 [Eumeta japonica]|uniref:Uncharacterized protein n=1 Tax=Eumeta variegata TaxID=151549 RepID=A0A4C1WUE7_EUMVA|nr:hypothetical protein EVAR_43267_1 [Eumeta japonica]